jgi:uncharacterized protein YggE
MSGHEHPTLQRETTLSLAAEASVSRAPDLAILSAGVQVNGDTAQAAMAEQARLMNGVMAALKAAGIADRDLQTSNLSLNPRYEYRDNVEPKIIGYTASNQLTVRVRNLDKVGQTIDALVSRGGNTLNGISFGLDKPEGIVNEARKAAMAEALARANLYASAAGLKVKRIVTISEGGGWAPTPVPMMAMARMEMAAPEPTPIAGGEVSFSASINVVFELEK